MTPYVTTGPRRGPNGTAPPRCRELDHRFRRITGWTFCILCNLPWRSFIGSEWPR